MAHDVAAAVLAAVRPLHDAEVAAARREGAVEALRAAAAVLPTLPVNPPEWLALIADALAAGLPALCFGRADEIGADHG